MSRTLVLKGGPRNGEIVKCWGAPFRFPERDDERGRTATHIYDPWGWYRGVETEVHDLGLYLAATAGTD